MTKLPVVILGAGHVHALSYVRRLQAHPDVELVGIYDQTPSTARHLSEEAGTVAFGSVADALDKARAVAVCPEPTRQLALVQAAAAEELPVLCEKPFGTNFAEATALLQLSKRVPVSVALPVRYHPAAVKLKVAVQSGALGAAAAVWATNRNSFPGGWFADRSLAGGGCLLDHLVHVADLVRWIWGTELVSATAEAATSHNPGLEVEDTGRGPRPLLQWPRGLARPVNVATPRYARRPRPYVEGLGRARYGEGRHFLPRSRMGGRQRLSPPSISRCRHGQGHARRLGGLGTPRRTCACPGRRRFRGNMPIICGPAVGHRAPDGTSPLLRTGRAHRQYGVAHHGTHQTGRSGPSKPAATDRTA